MPPFIAVRVAFASDPLDDTPTWTDITPYVKSVSTSSGRQQETDEFQAGRLSVTLDNHDRRFDPLHTGSPYSPNLKPRKRIQVSAGGYLNLPGTDNARATCPDSAALDITGDLDLRAAIRMNDWTPVADFNLAAIIGKADASLASYGLFVTSTGALTLVWVDAGGTQRTATSTVTLGFGDGLTFWIRATLDVDNGAAGRDIRFYQSSALPTDFVPAWTQVGATVTQAGTTTVQANASAGFAGAIGSIEEWAGRFYRGEVRNGIDGPIVASPNFMVDRDGPVRDIQGNVWSLQAGATLVAEPGLFPMWTGFVDGWPQTTFRPPSDAETTITATDMFVLLANIDLPRSVYVIEVSADIPTVWYGLGEGTGSEAQDLSGNALHGTYGVSPTDRAAPPIVFGDSGSAGKRTPVTRDASNLATGLAPPLVSRQGGHGITLFPSTVEVWANIAHTELFPFIPLVTLFAIGEAGVAYVDGLVRIVFTPSNTLEFHIEGFAHNQNNTSAFTEVQTPYTVMANSAHHFVFVFNGPDGGVDGLKIYVDGSAVPTTVSNLGAVSVAVSGVVVGAGQGMTSLPPAVGDPHDLQDILDEFAVYEGELPAARIAAHHAAGTTPWGGDTTGARITRILDLVGIGAGDRLIDTGVTILGPTGLATDALSYCKSIERTEDGQFYVAHQEGPWLRFRDRHKQFTDARATTSQAAFSDDPADATAVRVEPGDIQIWIDEQLLVNEATVQWDAGQNAASDATSITSFGRRATTIDTRLKSSNEAQNLAEWKVFRRKNPLTRINSLAIRPSADRTQWPAALGLRIGDRVTFRFHPQQVGTAINLPFRVEGVDHRIGDGVNEWTTTFDLSPVDATADNVWIWDTSEWEEVDPNPTTRWAY